MRVDPDFQPYLRSISAAYEKWWQCSTLTDANDIKPETFDFGWVETVRSAERDCDRAESPEKPERLPVLAGLRKYAGEAMLRQLGDRLRELGQTPLLLWRLPFISYTSRL